MRPKIAAKARLKDDAKSGKTLLLYPEAGLELNGSSAQVLKRCDGTRTVAAIVDELCALYGGAPREQVEKDVGSLLERLVKKGLVQWET